MMRHPYVCPETRRPLTPLSKKEIDELGALIRDQKVTSNRPLLEKLDGALGTDDRKVFYQVCRGIPDLMPDSGMRLEKEGAQAGDGVGQALKDIEEEAALYDKIALDMARNESVGQFGEKLRPGIVISDEEKKSFPRPPGLWLDAPIALTSQEKAYEWIAPMEGRRALQMGGHGSHAIKFLLAGASEAYLLSPSLEELAFGQSLSAKFGVADRFFPVQGIAEKFPFEDNSFDAIYGGGCLHHTRLKYSAAEIHRILKPGGSAAFVEPRMTLWYRMGRKVMPTRGLGDVESLVQGDRPLYQAEIDQFTSLFRVKDVHSSRVLIHIPLTIINRYLHVDIPLKIIHRIEALDSAVINAVSILKRAAPIVAICVKK